MDQKVVEFYREIYSDLEVDHQEAQQLAAFFASLNPPPDKLVWLRSTAFRIACEFLSDDNNDDNVALLRAINAIVHFLEQACMKSKVPEGNSTFDADAATEFYKGLFQDLKVDEDENAELFNFFNDNIPPEDDLIQMRATAFKAAVEFLSPDDKDTNVSLLRSINCAVHAFEATCLSTKDYELKLEDSFDLDLNLSDAIQQLWNLDVNRLSPNEDYVLNVQSGKDPYMKEDGASDALFASLNKKELNRPTYKSFIALLDNYIAQTGTEEELTNAERQEVRTFLQAIMQTAPMQFCHKYLHAKIPDQVPEDTNGFLQVLHNIWFELYSRKRGGRLDSSGFEHVFVGEVKHGKISGFHNWIQYYLEEQNGSIDYRGYIKPKSTADAETDSNDHLLTLQFEWKGAEKFVGSMFVGVSPEFEMALYSTCFLLGEESNPITLNTGTDAFDLEIKCYRSDDDKIGTSFPQALAHYE